MGVISKPKILLQKADFWLSKNTQTVGFILKIVIATQWCHGHSKGVIATSPYQLSEITTLHL